METVSPQTFLEPERIVRYFGLERGDHAADFGAGHGYFTIPMARAVGGDGRVYALDIQKAALDIIRSKARIEHLLNIDLIWTDLDMPRGSKLKDKFLDFVLISNILFQMENKERLFEEAFRALREKGALAVVEWDETPTPLGPALGLRVKKADAMRLAKDAGFEELDREFEAGSHHYGLLFRKP